LSKLKLANKKNPRKLLEEIASCKVKYGVPVSDSKKVAQLIRLGRKKYGTVITVTQKCKKSRKLRAPQSKLWTRCGNNEESKVEKRKTKRMPTMKKRPLCQKLTRKSRVKESIVQKKRTTKARRRKRLTHATTVE
jgi:hypothetical protein